jgi:protease I
MSDAKKDRLSGVRVAILATDGFEEAELLEPRKALEDAGARTAVIAPKTGKLQGMKHNKNGKSVEVDLALAEADPSEFDALLLPGGAFNADALRMDMEAQAFAKAMDGNGRPIAVICHGPWLLDSAGLTRGRTLTSYFTIQDDIRNSGGNWVDQEVIRDRNWVSSRKPDDIPAFNQEMLALFEEAKPKAQAANPQ